jgi:Zn-dependent protease with chaperone function
VSFDPSLPDDQVNVSHSHPAREAALLIAGLLAAVTLVVLGVGEIIDRVVPRLPPALELRLFPTPGLSVPDEVREPLPREAGLQPLLERLALRWPDSPYRFHVVVWEEAQRNAFALPGGWIALTTGLLKGAGSENEIAFVLGHEIGHFRNRDHLRGLGRGLVLQLMMAALGAGGSAAQLAEFAGELTQRGFDRDQERAADRFALEIVAAEYGHVQGAGDFLRGTPESDEGFDAGLDDYLSTHPLDAERLAAIETLTAERGWPTDGELTPLSDQPARPSPSEARRD